MSTFSSKKSWISAYFMAYYYKQVRVSGYGGWFLLRLSLHDPVLPLNIEVFVFPSSLDPNEDVSES